MCSERDAVVQPSALAGARQPRFRRLLRNPAGTPPAAPLHSTRGTLHRLQMLSEIFKIGGIPIHDLLRAVQKSTAYAWHWHRIDFLLLPSSRYLTVWSWNRFYCGTWTAPIYWMAEKMDYNFNTCHLSFLTKRNTRHSLVYLRSHTHKMLYIGIILLYYRY